MDDSLQQLSRREILAQAGSGFGMLALAGILGAQSSASEHPRTERSPKTHFRPRAKRVIFLFMNGGPSHVDTFDPKPTLARYQGQKPSGKLYKASKAGYLPSPFAFRPHGQSGVVLSELFPHLSNCADDLCVIRSMHTDVPNHEPGLLVMQSGHQQPTRPSVGSWVSYGLGCQNQNLPSYVAIAPGMPVVGPQLWSNSFLPGKHQGMAVDTSDLQVHKLVANLQHPHLAPQQQQRQLSLLQKLNGLHQRDRPEDAALEAHIDALETAFRMQTEASEAFDVGRESPRTREAYGRSLFGQSCLLARRLSERGVRFVQVYYVDRKNKQPWDTHSDNDRRHRQLCADSDQATAALLSDLKNRGLLEETLVVWTGEFGRTPYAQPSKKGKPGRDHHHTGFSTVLAGGGVRGGQMYGATDEFGMNAIENRMHVHDLHATMLHLLGLDHTRLTYRYSGRDFRLTDVHGRVVQSILA